MVSNATIVPVASMLGSRLKSLACTVGLAGERLTMRVPVR